MITTEILRQNKIFDWSDIALRYDKPNLLLGNGFSLQFSENFSYNSLFNLFLENCDDTHKDLFSYFGTVNFEQILSYLTYAKKVNELLENNDINDINQIMVENNPIEYLINAIKYACNC